MADIQTIWRYGYANMAYSDFVKQYYLLYLRNAMPGGYQGPASACSIAGQTRCFNNWLMTCNGRQWMTGATRC